MSNVVKIKQLKNSNELNNEIKLELIAIGRPLPALLIHRFQPGLYDLADWLCGCNVTNAIYCFVCLLFSEDTAWCRTGVTDLRHLKERVHRHGCSVEHLRNVMSFNTINKIYIGSQLYDGLKQSIVVYNVNVRKNLVMLHEIIEGVKSCEVFELAVRKYDDTEPTLIDFFTGLEPIFQKYSTEADVLDDIADDLLDCMFSVAHEQIRREIEQADFVSLQVDELTDSSGTIQLAFTVRYVLAGVVCERFINLVDQLTSTSEQYTRTILGQLEKLGLNKTPEKLIGQSYDAASGKSGGLGGVVKRIKKHYPNARFVHSYAHDLHHVLEKVTRRESSVDKFFANLLLLQRISKQTPAIDELVGGSGAPLRCVAGILANKSKTLSRLEGIGDDRDSLLLKGLLQDEDFAFWLDFFHTVVPHCERLFASLHRCGVSSLTVRETTDSFKASLQMVRAKILNDLCVEKTSSGKDESNRRVALSVCDVIFDEMIQRFSYSDQLIMDELLHHHEIYKNKIPSSIDVMMERNLPTVRYRVLWNELSAIYEREYFSPGSGIVSIMQFFLNNNLKETFSESIRLQTFLCTLPVALVDEHNDEGLTKRTSDPEDRCFDTLKKIRRFLRNAASLQRKLGLFAVLSVGKSFIGGIKHYNRRVIKRFVNLERRVEEWKIRTVQDCSRPQTQDDVIEDAVADIKVKKENPDDLFEESFDHIQPDIIDKKEILDHFDASASFCTEPPAKKLKTLRQVDADSSQTGFDTDKGVEDGVASDLMGCVGNLDMFFQSMLAMARTLSPLDQVRLQQKIANDVFEMKVAQLTRESRT